MAKKLRGAAKRVGKSADTASLVSKLTDNGRLEILTEAIQKEAMQHGFHDVWFEPDPKKKGQEGPGRRRVVTAVTDTDIHALFANNEE